MTLPSKNNKIRMIWRRREEGGKGKWARTREGDEEVVLLHDCDLVNGLL
jgi:hypothetical protein